MERKLIWNLVFGVALSLQASFVCGCVIRRLCKSLLHYHCYILLFSRQFPSLRGSSPLLPNWSDHSHMLRVRHVILQWILSAPFQILISCCCNFQARDPFQRKRSSGGIQHILTSLYYVQNCPTFFTPLSSSNFVLSFVPTPSIVSLSALVVP